MGTRFGAKLPGPRPPQEDIDDLRGSSPFREVGSGNDFFLSTDRRMSARWSVGLRNIILRNSDLAGCS
jgi:hypothetical protein